MDVDNPVTTTAQSSIDIISIFIGRGVVVDYLADSESKKSFTAKGRLINVEGNKVIISNRQRLWVIDLSRVMNFVVDKEDV